MNSKDGSSSGQAAVFLDRDGVLNEVRMHGQVARGPRDVDELQITSEAVRAVERLRAAGLVLLVVSNQPDVARGELPPEAVERMNRRLVELLAVDGVYHCPHDDADGCECRKPKPGMILAGAADFGVDLARSWMIGDRWVDVAAAGAAGVASILLEREYSWRATHAGAPPPGLRPDHVARNLAECVDVVLGARAIAGKHPRHGPARPSGHPGTPLPTE
jgi:D-glycero-D-manno-heptose 1,7-bisphosphate phosphatase